MSQILKKGVFSSSLELVVVFRVDIFFFSGNKPGMDLS